jgi:CRP/FNR family cyclic AMP-dependent transcriptional regulator
MEQLELASLPLTHYSMWLARIRLATGLFSRDVVAGHLVAREGEVPNCLHVVEMGSVGAFTTGPQGQRAVVAVVGPGEAFGHEGMPKRKPDRPVLPGFIALVPTRLLSVPFPQLWAAFRRDPEIAGFVVTSLAGLLERVQRQLVRTLTLRVQERLAGLLEELGSAHGRPCTEGVRVDLPLTQEMLAWMVGATRESVNRAMRSLQREGRVRRSGRAYVLGRGAEPETIEDPFIGPDDQEGMMTK